MNCLSTFADTPVLTSTSFGGQVNDLVDFHTPRLGVASKARIKHTGRVLIKPVLIGMLITS